jgi:hypothetical protein
MRKSSKARTMIVNQIKCFICGTLTFWRCLECHGPICRRHIEKDDSNRIFCKRCWKVRGG